MVIWVEQGITFMNKSAREICTWLNFKHLINFDNGVYASHLKSHGLIPLVKFILTDISAKFHRLLSLDLFQITTAMLNL